MGFFDREVRNGFDEMFDYNRDGVLDYREQGLQTTYLDRMSNGLDPWDTSSSHSSSSYDDYDDFDSDGFDGGDFGDF